MSTALKHSVETMQKLAKEKGVTFLSKEYLGVDKHHLWECALGHQWKSKPSNIKYIPYGKCPICSGKAKLSFGEIKNIIESKNGFLISENFQRGKDYIKIKCEKNHTWDTQVFNIKHGKWCPHCARITPLNIITLRELAEKRGGKCLSINYTNANGYYLWQCSEGHQWEAKYGNIYTGNWCKQCKGSTGERICRLFFEQIFKCEFPSVFPKWLKNKSGRSLQLDGFNENLKIAFEHQGEQHNVKTTLYYKNDETFNKRKEYDEIKRVICKRQGITLIEVPEINNKLKVKDIKNFLKEEFIKNNIKLPTDFDTLNINIDDAYNTPQWKSKLKKQKDIARSKGGECLSNYYEGNNVKLEYICKDNHKWMASPQKISLGRWCPKCAIKERANKMRGNIKDMQILAKTKGGKCLSNDYLGCEEKLLWKCSLNHSWKAIPLSIKRGSWCPECYKNRPTKSKIKLKNINTQLKLDF